MGDCLSCGEKSPLTTSLDEPLKGSRVQTCATTNPKNHEDFWTGSARDMDNSAVLSQGSISSISTSNQTLDPHAGSATSPSEFVNHGLFIWNQTRQHWTKRKKPENRQEQIREPKISWDATYESLLRSDKPFQQPIPLAEMVDFLVYVWEHEGTGDD